MAFNEEISLEYRVMLTSAPSTQDSYPPATMETTNSMVEETFYANLPQTRSAKPVGFDSNTGNASVARVSSTAGMKQVGPSVTLKVNAGDKLELKVKSFFKNSEANYNRNPLLQEMLTLLLNGLVNPTGVTGQTATKAREIASNQIFGTSSYSGTLSSIAPSIYNTILMEHQKHTWFGRFSTTSSTLLNRAAECYR